MNGSISLIEIRRTIEDNLLCGSLQQILSAVNILGIDDDGQLSA